MNSKVKVGRYVYVHTTPPLSLLPTSLLGIELALFSIGKSSDLSWRGHISTYIVLTPTFPTVLASKLRPPKGFKPVNLVNDSDGISEAVLRRACSLIFLVFI